MSQVVELDEQGALLLPPDVLARVRPHTRFLVEVQGETLLLHPEEPSTQTMLSPTAHAEAIRHWASLERPPYPILDDDALRREHLYDE